MQHAIRAMSPFGRRPAWSWRAGGGWRCGAVALVLLLGLAGMPARAQQGSPAGVALTPEQARQALDVLQDDARRQQVLDVLRAVASAVPVGAPVAGPGGVPAVSPGAAPAPATAMVPAGVPAPAASPAAPPAASPAGAEHLSLTSDSLLAQIIAALSDWLSVLSGHLAAAGGTLASVPLVWRWLVRVATNPFAQTAVLDVAWRLAAVLAVAWTARWLLARALRGPARGLEARAEARVAARREARAAGDIKAEPVVASRAELHLLRRAPLALLRLVLELIPIAGFAAAGNLLLATPLSDGGLVPLIILAAVNAFVVQHVIMAVGRAVVSPGSRPLRPFRLSDESAAYAELWLGRVTGVAIYGMAVLEVARLLGLYPAAYAAAAKLVILLSHLLLIVVVLQCRRQVAARIDAPDGSTSAFALARHWFARIWHVVVIFLLLALWFVWALRIENGYGLLLRYLGATAAVLLVARLVAVAVLGLLDRVFRIKAETAQRLPLLEGRANRYVPLLRRTVTVGIGAVTVLALLQVWGLDVAESFTSGGLGQRIASSVIVLLIAGVAAVLAWEGVNSWIDRRIADMSARGDLARAGRLRTLLPLLHTTLLVVIVVVIGFTALSQLGVNVAPLLAGAGIVGVAVGFGSQKLVQDVITGIFLLLENTMQVGDWVTVSGLSGTVENLSIRTIRLRAGDGSVHVIPFSSVTTVTNTNKGIGNAAVSVTVAFSESPNRVGEVLKEIGAGMRAEPAYRNQILDDFALWGVDKVDGATFTVLGQLPCKDTARWGVQREFNRRIKERFQELGIEIAVPAQSVIISRPGREPREGEGGREEAWREPAGAGPAAERRSPPPAAERHSPPPAALGNTQ